MKKLLLLLLVSILVFTGCQSDSGDQEDANNDDPGISKDVDNEDETEDDADNGGSEDNEEIDTRDYHSITVSVEEAYDVFMDKYPNAKINEIELEKEGRSYEYKIEGYEGNMDYELKIDAFTKEVLDVDEDREDDEFGEIKREDLDKIDGYVEEALADAGSGYWLEEWELKVKSDYVKFEIELKNDSGAELEYKYNYETGELLKKDD